MRFASLGSGSSGNATLVAAGETTVLVDCGLSVKTFDARAHELGFDPAAIDAVLVTHEHGDHLGGVPALARRYGLEVFATPGTFAAAGARTFDGVACSVVSPHRKFAIGELGIAPAIVPHDAREPCQFVIEDGAARLGILTDLGRPTPFLRDRYAACDCLILEFNHEPALLAGCAYPGSVKRRVAGDFGHLNNQQALAMLALLETAPPRHVVAAHISENSNDPGLVEDLLAAAAAAHGFTFAVTRQRHSLPWTEVVRSGTADADSDEASVSA